MSKRFLVTFNKYKSAFLLLFMLLMATAASQNFATVRNVTNVLQQVAPNGIVAVGLTLVVITGGFDMSVGSVMALSGIVAMMHLSAGGGLFTAVCLALLVGLGVGLVNGFLIGVVGVNPFITTLGTMTLVRGIAMGVTDTYPITYWHDAFSRFAAGKQGFLPYSFLVVLILAVLAGLFLTYTKPGHSIFIYGSNREAGTSAGINMGRTLMISHMLCSLCAALAGLFLASKIGAGSPVVADDASLLAMTAIIIGGNKLSGSRANLLRTLIGVLTLGVLNNMMNLMRTMAYFQTIIKGLLVIVVIAMDAPGVQKYTAKLKQRLRIRRSI